MLDKKSLRHTIRERKKQHSAEALQQLSDAITQRLLRHPLLQRAQTVMLYYSLPDEVNTHALVNQLVSDGKTVLLPRVTGESTMELRRYASENDLELGAFNIMEPVGELFTDLESHRFGNYSWHGVRPKRPSARAWQRFLRSFLARYDCNA